MVRRHWRQWLFCVLLIVRSPASTAFHLISPAARTDGEYASPERLTSPTASTRWPYPSLLFAIVDCCIPSTWCHCDYTTYHHQGPLRSGGNTAKHQLTTFPLQRCNLSHKQMYVPTYRTYSTLSYTEWAEASVTIGVQPETPN